jgi:hypothetical protein
MLLSGIIRNHLDRDAHAPRERFRIDEAIGNVAAGGSIR